MEHFSKVDRMHKVLHSLSKLPQRMLQVHDADNLAEFVLHDLCHKDCFDIQRAAYVVDNPDFQFLKGVAGYDRSDLAECALDWDQPDSFVKKMCDSEFNQKVRALHITHGTTLEDNIEAIARGLHIEHPVYHSFPLKYGNKGIFVYEAHRSDIKEIEEHITRGICYLGFCPIL